MVSSSAIIGSSILLTTTILVHHICWWLLSLRGRRYDYADIAWGTGGICGALILTFHAVHTSWRLALCGLLVTLWGIRLALHLALRSRARADDYRYIDQYTPYRPLIALIRVYLVQAVLLNILLTPLLVVAVSAADATPVACDYIGGFLWIVGFLYETIADIQLTAYQQQGHDRPALLQTGVWRLSRHPNYCGELLQWWGIGIIALSLPYGWIGMISPLLITALITCISGLPLVEKPLQKLPGYTIYRSTTSAIIPIPPAYYQYIRPYIPASITIGYTLFVAISGTIFVRHGIASGWYGTLRLPSITPPSWVFSIVWTILYSATCWSALRAWRSEQDAQRWRITIGLYGLMGLLNIGWTYLFFFQHQQIAASILTAGIATTLILLIKRLWQRDMLAAALLIPHGLWILYAWILQIGILYTIS